MNRVEREKKVSDIILQLPHVPAHMYALPHTHTQKQAHTHREKVHAFIINKCINKTIFKRLAILTRKIMKFGSGLWNRYYALNWTPYDVKFFG